MYKTLFGETLVEPSGGDYVWNQERGTYVSTLHGYHLEPKAGPSIRLDMRADDELNAELEFQNAGLRAKLSIPNQ